MGRDQLLPRFEEIERELEALDAKVMTDIPSDVSRELTRLVSCAARSAPCGVPSSRTVRWWSLWPIPSLICCRTEASSARLAALENRVAQAVDAAREAKESTRGSFELLVARIGQRTNDIMKLLTLATVILLPATVLAGIMGMNFQLGLFNWMFWMVIGAMLGIAVLVLSIARSRDWL